MPDAPAIPRKALLLVADGARALILRNVAPALELRLELVGALEAPDNPPDREHDPSERPGRLPGPDRRGAVAQTDRHEAAERRFEAEAAAAFAAMAEAEPEAPLVVVCAPRSLSAVRAALPARLRARVAVEIAKDMVNHPVDEISRILRPR